MDSVDYDLDLVNKTSACLLEQLGGGIQNCL